MSDIDQQAVFDRLPLTAEQRKKLYATITSAVPQTDSVILADSSVAPCSLVHLIISPTTQLTLLRKHVDNVRVRALAQRVGL